MKEKINLTGKGKAVTIGTDFSITQGSKTYNYFHSIQIPILLARINRLEKRFLAYFSKNIEGGYLNEMIRAYHKFLSSPGDICSTVWSDTAETPIASNVETLTLPVGTPVPNSLPTEALFPKKGETKENSPEFSDDISPPYVFNPSDEPMTGSKSILHLWSSTTITMKYLHDPSTRRARVKYLQQKLGGTVNPEAIWVQQAQHLSETLVKLSSEVVDGKSKKKVLLFNYRKGDVNKQHDANIDLLGSVAEVASAMGFAVIPVIVNASDEEVMHINKLGFMCLELYKKGIAYDKRYTAAFWAVVANTLQDKIVHGLIGGRSGSMDIASFMGVNTCSFDEPIWGSECKYEPAYVNSQGGQLLRLLAQRAMMSVVYVDTDSHYGIPEGKKYINAYKRLEEKGLTEWLDRTDLAAPHISPPLSVKDIDVSYSPLLSFANPTDRGVDIK